MGLLPDSFFSNAPRPMYPFYTPDILLYTALQKPLNLIFTPLGYTRNITLVLFKEINIQPKFCLQMNINTKSTLNKVFSQNYDDWKNQTKQTV